MIDAWYKAVMYLGAVLFVVSCFLDVKGLTNGQLQLLSAGAFLIGLGEWKNHKHQSWIKPPNVYTGGVAVIKAIVRRPDFVGGMLDLVGLALMGLGCWRIAIS